MTDPGDDGPQLPSTLGDPLDELGALSVGRSLAAPTDPSAVVLPTETSERYADETEELGRGGIGRVYAAFDQQLGREVAIKELLRDGQGGSEGSLSSLERRFVQEARITGQLEHPAIVPVHELGVRPDGSLFYTMKRVRGRTLAAALHDAEGLPGRLALLGHVLDMCQAVAYAHSRGIVHRDLKPANVMVGAFGDTVVLDWGLAKHVGETDATDDLLSRELAALDEVQRGRTMMGTALGTPAYMSPEQARGEVDAIDTRSDVWGLGAVLYEVLTGQPPHLSDRVSALEKARTGEVRPIHEHTPDAPADLVAVVAKALAVAPDHRYVDAGALAEELDAWMQGRRVQAFRYSTFDLAKRLVLRNKAFSAVVAAALVGAGAGSVALYDAWRVAEARAIEATANEREAHAMLSVAYAEKATDLLDADAPEEAMVFAAAALVHTPDAPGSAWHDGNSDAGELARLRGLLADARARSLVEHTATLGPFGRAIRNAEGSRDGRYLAVQRGGGNVDIIDVEAGRIAHRLELQAQTHDAVAWLDDGTLFVPGSFGVDVQRMRIDGTVVSAFPHGLLERGMRMVAALDATPDGSSVVVSGLGDLLVFDGTTGELRHQLPSRGANRVAISADGSRVLAYGDGSDSALYDVEQGTVLRRFDQRGALDAAFVGERLYVATADGLQVMRTDTGADTGRRTDRPTSRLSVAPDGTLLITVEPSGAVLRTAADLQPVATLPGSDGAPDPWAVWAGQERLARLDGISGGRVHLYRVRDDAPTRWVPPLFPRAMLASADGRVVGVGDGSSAALLDAETGGLVARVDGVLGTQVLPLGAAGLGVSDLRLRVHLYNVGPDGPTHRGTPIDIGPDQTDVVRTPGVGPIDGQAAVDRDRFAYAQVGGPVRIHDSATGRPLQTLPHSTDPQHMAFDTGGQRLAVCATTEVRTYGVDTGEELAVWSLPAPCASVAWSPTGDALVAADGTGQVHRLDATGGTSPIWTFRPPVTVSWTESGVVVDEASKLHLLDPVGDLIQSVARHDAGVRHTHVGRGDGEAIWFGDGASLRRLPPPLEASDTPEALLRRAELHTGLRLDGMDLSVPLHPPLPADDARAFRGQTFTTDRGWISHGEAQLLDRHSLEPVGTVAPIRADGSFAVVPPPSQDGELALRIDAEGFVPTIHFSPSIRAGHQLPVWAITLGGARMVSRLAQVPVTPSWGTAVIVQHHYGDRPPTPVGCAEVSADPAHPVLYSQGNNDSARSTRQTTHPFDGMGSLMGAPNQARRIRVLVGGEARETDIPELLPGYSAFVWVPFTGSDPTPSSCR